MTHAWGPYPMTSVRIGHRLYPGHGRDDHYSASDGPVYQQSAHASQKFLAQQTDHRFRSGPTGTWEFSRYGKQFTDTTRLMVPWKAEYRFVIDAVRPQDHAAITLGGKIRTEPTAVPAAIRAEFQDCARLRAGALGDAIPVVRIDYGMKADLRNEVGTGLPFTFGLWKQVPTPHRDKSSFRAARLHPNLSPTDGYVSLKAEVRDGAASRTVQTLNSTYALR